MRILIEHPDFEQADYGLVTMKERKIINMRSADSTSNAWGSVQKLSVPQGASQGKADSVRSSIYYSGAGKTSVSGLEALQNRQENHRENHQQNRQENHQVNYQVNQVERPFRPAGQKTRQVGRARSAEKVNLSTGQSAPITAQGIRMTGEESRWGQRRRLAEQRPSLTRQEERLAGRDRVSRLRIWSRQTGRLLLILLFLIAVLAALIPLWGEANKSEGVIAEETIRVLMASGEVRTMALEEYLIGVVAAEMPANFEEDALKAQAVASRTFAARRISSAQESGETYDVDTTTATQVWRSEEQMRERWGSSYEENRSKIAAAVQQTAGEVLLFDDNLATTVFFSNTGRLPTENSTDVWGGNFSYLSSVSSPETDAPDEYIRQKSMSIEDFLHALKLDSKKNLSASDIKVLERTAAGRIASISVAGQVMKGTDFRRALELASTDVEWKISGGQILLTTYGNGHAVGLSQYGAQNMALSGKNYQDILAHYYQGTQLESGYTL